MRLSEILAVKGQHVHTVSPDDTVMDAVHKLVTYNIGALAVIDEKGRLVGIISERDILRMLPREAADLGATKVAQRMTRDVVTAEPGADTDACLDTMTGHRIRHLPVCERGKLTGMVSIGDLVKAKLDDAVFEARHLTTMVTGQYPA